MPDISSVESAQQLANQLAAIEKFFKENISENITQYVLGDTGVRRKVKRITDYVNYFNNIFSLAFVFAHGCLRCDNDSEDPINQKATKQTALRVINSLRKAYVQYPVTAELIQFVLSDIQFEMLMGNDSELYEVFEKLCTFRSRDFSLAKYYKVIAQWRAAPSRFNMDRNELAAMFYKLLQNMTFLRSYDLVRDEDGGFSFVDKEAALFGSADEKYSVVPVNHLLYYDPDLYIDVYTLYSVEKIQDAGAKKLIVRYALNDSSSSLSFTVSELPLAPGEDSERRIFEDAADYYYSIFGEDWDFFNKGQDAEPVNFIDQVHAINYKYIKNLALAISDAISANRGSKEALYHRYRHQYPDVFREVEQQLMNSSGESDAEDIKLDWDGVVVMLLIESSPTSVLETLFRSVPQTFVAIARNLCKRIDSPDFPLYGKGERALDDMVNDVVRTRLILGETSGFGKIPRKQLDRRSRARAEALLIISSLSYAHEEEAVERAICAGNVYDNIALLKRMREEFQPDQRCRYVSIILGETFRHLLCFYCGLFAFGAVKAKYDAESCNRVLSEVQIASYQKQLQTRFIDAAKNEAEEIQQLNSAVHADMIQLMERFVRLCETCNTPGQSASVKGHNLFSAIGKHEIMDVAEFKAHVHEFTDLYRDINEANVDQWINFALEILRYLRRGNFSRGEETPFHAIYPFIATYNRGNENYDGYKTVTFTMNLNFDGDDKAEAEYVNVLSEFSYSLTNVFYCLPNVLRSNKRWWIDPLLVSFKDFNDIFVE